MRAVTLAIALILLPAIVQAQNAFLRQQRIYSGDIAELTIVHDAGIPSMYAIDTAPLLDDFEVLETESRMFRITQGTQTTHRMEWRARLLPRRIGTLVIPSLMFGDHRSTPLTLTVEPLPPELDAAQRVFVEIEAQPPNPYPGQQTRILFRLLHNFPLAGGRLREPEPNQAQTFRSGRERNFIVDRDGQAFHALERSILVLPLVTGQLDVRPARISTRLPVKDQDNDIDLESATRFVHRKSPALQLALRPLPRGVDANTWLPAEELAIEVDWLHRPENSQPGDTLDFLLTLRAAGLSAEALPGDLALHDSDYFTVYADPAVRQTRVVGKPGEEYLAGKLQQRYTVLLERSGTTRLPTLRLDWWDTRQDRARVAEVAGIPLEIGTAAAASNDGPAGEGFFPAERDRQAGAVIFDWSAYWPQLVTGVAGLALASIVAAFLRSHGGRLRARFALARARRYRLRQLRRACFANAPVAAREHLLGWCRLRWPEQGINGLRQLARINASPHWREALARLDAANFAARGEGWQGRGLWSLVRRIGRPQRSGETGQRSARLPGPYPSRPAVTSLRPG